MEATLSVITPLSTAGELDDAVAIWLAGSLAAHHFIDCSYWLQHATDMKEHYLPQAETWIYKEEGKTVGFISLVDTYLASLFVHPDGQSKGIGSQLLAKAKALRDELQLAVYVKNGQAVRFYHKHGFKVNETRIDPHTGEEEYVMIWKK